jgi:hypothetical protein
MLKQTTIALMGLFAWAGAGQALAQQSDPSVAQVYEAARGGHMEEAQQMINQVLRDHPSSGRAHYVAAELDAKSGNASGAQRELNTAQQLEPGLPFAKPEAVAALRREISQSPRGNYDVSSGGASRGSSVPWGLIGLIAAGLVIFAFLLRRRPAPVAYSPYPSTMPGGPGVPGTMGGPGFPSVMGGGGSGIMGGIASGLAVGAGLAAGEELIHHVFDSSGRSVGGTGAPFEGGSAEPGANNDMGGSDFGMPDAGSWDDSGSSGGGDSGGDWT